MAVQAWMLGGPSMGESEWAAICISKIVPKTKYGHPVYILCYPDEPVNWEGEPFDPVEWATEAEARSALEFSSFRIELIEFRTV